MSFVKKFILDVDGVLTTGHSIYSEKGKIYKIFGPHDSDGLKIIKNKINTSFISADKRGFSITKKRIEDLGFSVLLVSEEERLSFFKNQNPDEIIFMGDGYFDSEVMKIVKYSIAPKNARPEAIKQANYVTPSRSGEGAVLDACLHIDQKFFK
tara:strand:- start:46358 stop:46816 length:459 start_codon:yes stop_codon:yes gene_type:complete